MVMKGSKQLEKEVDVAEAMEKEGALIKVIGWTVDLTKNVRRIIED